MLCAATRAKMASLVLTAIELWSDSNGRLKIVPPVVPVVDEFASAAPESVDVVTGEHKRDGPCSTVCDRTGVAQNAPSKYGAGIRRRGGRRRGCSPQRGGLHIMPPKAAPCVYSYLWEGRVYERLRAARVTPSESRQLRHRREVTSLATILALPTDIKTQH